MTLHVRVGGVWRESQAPSLRVSGAWRNLVAGWVKVSGTWRQFYVSDNTGPTVPLPTLAWNQGTPGLDVTWGAITDSSGVATATLRYKVETFTGGTLVNWTDLTAINPAGGTYQHAIPTEWRARLMKYQIIATDTVGNLTSGAVASKYAKPLGSFGIAAVDSGTWAQHQPADGSSPGGWRSTFDLHSGRYDASTYGHQVGLWLYGTGIADTCRGYAPDVASIYMVRNASYGYSGYNNIAPHAYESKPHGVPTIGGGEAIPGPYTNEDQGPVLTGANDFETYALPSAWLTMMGNATLKGVAAVDSGVPTGQQGSGGSYRRLKGIDIEPLSGFLTLEFD